jgi:thiol-disulfide isomerase/thioredoxin
MIVLNSLIFFSCLVIWVSSSEVFDGELTDILNSEHIYAVEFFSGMCGSCKEFKPIWEEYSNKMNAHIKTTKVDIDTSKGMKIAQSLGILDEGIPNVKLIKYTSKKRVKETKSVYNGEGEMPTVTSLVKTTKMLIKDHVLSDEGKFLKRLK